MGYGLEVLKDLGFRAVTWNPPRFAPPLFGLKPQTAEKLLGLVIEGAKAAGWGVKPQTRNPCGQVYKARVGGKDVAVKVLRPNVMADVAADSFLIRTMCVLGEGIRNPLTGARVIKPALVDGCDEFFSRIFEEADYRHEAQNMVRICGFVLVLPMAGACWEGGERHEAQNNVRPIHWLAGSGATARLRG